MTISNRDLKANTFLSGQDVYYPGTLKTIQKAKDKLQPLWEVITNAIEAIKDPRNTNRDNTITISFFYTKQLVPQEYFLLDKIEVHDSGIGFDDENLRRFLCFNDFSKGKNNRGTGRFQLIYSFDKILFDSIYRENDCFLKRAFESSCNKDFLQHNAIVYYVGDNIISPDNKTGTVVTLVGIKDKDDSSLFSHKTVCSGELEREIKNHYLPLYSAEENNPTIIIYCVENSTRNLVATITPKDFPKEDRAFSAKVFYTVFDQATKTYKKSNDHEVLNIKSFVFPKKELHRNAINIICKGELLPEHKIDFDFLRKEDDIDGKRFLLFVSCDYFDNSIGNTRDTLKLYSKDELIEDDFFIQEKVITIEDIKESVNREFKKHYPAAEKKEDEIQHKIQELQEMFLLDEKSVKAFLSDKSSAFTSEQQFLQKIYQIESSNSAKKDAKIKSYMDDLSKLNPNKADYPQKLNSITKSISKLIPLSNRNNLTRYIARRKLVLSLFEKALNAQLDIQQHSKRNNNEAILHNILFQQNSTNPQDSDLWLINEDFIYFSGTSNIKLGEIKIDEQFLFKDEARDFNSAYFKMFKQHPARNKPDILLFPEEGKCVIIELKNPRENVAKHLTQINNYASMLFSYSNPCFNFQTFFGYLIGEGITPQEVRHFDSDFKIAYRFGFLFRPHKTIVSDDDKEGSLYTEVINYSSLLQRAQIRNRIFIDKLLKR